MSVVTQEQINDKTVPSDRRCTCCAGAVFAPFHPGLSRCARCGHVSADLDWPPEMFHELYTRDYFKGGEYADYEEEAAALRLNFRRRVRDLAVLLPDGGFLWEIGCAYGFFLKEASDHFTAAGCDVAAEAVATAVEKQGVDARCLDYLTWQPERACDVVCLWDVIEHLPEPQLFLEKAFADLRPGGVLALSTGDIGSLCARLRGARWRQIHPPTHVHYFTRHSMSVLLNRLGYTAVSFRYPPFWRSMDTVAEKLLAGKVVVGPVYRALRHTGLLRFNFPLNLFDLMTVYARKPE
ncbi:MAG TPA: class I SAM-dependent methyltransferase [Candidatus Hydrogenedentes bacterium]|nr:class I SAM-dependent methyltransferase [Candidatus Hydrogenedentota bacterium]